MKKKILLITLMMALFVFVLAVYTNAAEIPEWTEITRIDGMKDKAVFGADGTNGATSRVLMSDGITYPAYYICKDSTSLGISFSDLNTKAGKTYAAKNVVRIELPQGIVTVTDALKVANGYSALMTVVIPEGATTISAYAFKAANTSTNSALVKVDIPSTVDFIGEQAFYCCNSLIELVIPEGVTQIPNNLAYYATSLRYVDIPSTVVSIGELAFRANTALACDIVIPEGCTDIGAYAFKGSGVTSVTLPSTIETVGKEIFMDCSALKSVYSKSTVIGNSMFYHCNELSTIKLENTIEIGNLAFNNSSLSKVSSLELPEGLTTIGEYAFPRMSITSVVIPSTVVNIGQYAFTANKSLEKVVVLGPIIGTNMFNSCSSLRTLVLTEKFETFGDNALASVPQDSFTTYYTGADYERIKTLCSSSTRFSQAGESSYADYTSGSYTSKKFMVIYDCNICTVGFDGHHVMRGNTEENFNSYLDIITFTDSCTREGCGKETVIKTIAPLFTCLGYSAPEDGRGGVTIGYTVNNEAIKEYTEATGKTLKYGVFVVLKDKLGDNDVFDKNGVAANGVLGAEIKNCEFAAFELKIVGFTDTQKDIKLAMGAYVAVTNGETTEYSYMQGGEPNENEKYCFVSYNDIVGIELV